MNENIIVVATWAEAKALGEVEYGSRYVSVAAGPRAVEGMRIGTIKVTEAATRYPGYDILIAVLKRAQAKTQGFVSE